VAGQSVEILVSNENDRSNLGIANFSNQTVTFDVTVLDFSGRRAPSGGAPLFSIRKGAQLPAWGWMQIDSAELMDLNGSRAAVASISVPSGPAALYAYGVINDRFTNDGSFLAPCHSPQVNPRGFAPAVETTGFVTELTVRDNGSPITPSIVLMSYWESLTPAFPGGWGDLAAPPRDHVIVDALATFRTMDPMSIGPKGAADYGGSLMLTPQYGASGQARTLSPSPGGGRFGVDTPWVSPDQAASDRAAVYGLVSDDLNRSNVAVMNIGDPPAHVGWSENTPVTLRLQVHDGASGGAVKGSPIDVTLAYGGWKQFNGILRDAGVTEGWVEVTRLSGSSVWAAYGVVNDGAYPGERTGDGAYVPMAR
jgi:hypothetical protein